MLKVFEAFAGIGSQTQALKNIGVEHEVVAIAEIDKYAIKSYEAIHGKVNNVGDITKVNTNDLPDFDLFTYSFPCQDISLAGKQKGLDKESGTRSSLLWECERIIRDKRPKYLLLENVKNLVGKKHKPNFDKWLSILEELGYKNYWKVLNAKDYGVAQNRERVFVVSIRNDIQKEFEFPKEQKLNTTLKDYLEKEVDEKFFLTEKLEKLLKFNSIYEENDKSLSKALIKNPLKSKTNKGWHFEQNVYTEDSALRALEAGGGSGNIPKILIKNATKKGYLEAENNDGINLAYPNSTTRRGRVQKECSPTLTTNDQVGVIDELRIRKLTPKECWRLMGFKDEHFEKAEKVCSNTQLYKQAGNSIVVNVLEAIFTNLFKED